VEAAVEWIRRARRGVSFSGAGLSVASGRPTYRGPGGLWEGADPQVLTERRLRRDPLQFWEFFRRHWLSYGAARPNPAHAALVELERRGHLVAHLTQNVDGLLQAAGAGAVVELHGHLRTVRCLVCERSQPIDAARSAGVPRCTHCGGVLRPDVVMFGDPLAPATVEAAMRRLREADLVLVVGTTLEVQPAATLLTECRSWETPTLVVDPAPALVPGGRVCYLEGPAEVLLPGLTRGL